VSRYAPLLLLVAVCISCKPAQQPPPQPAKPSAAGPQVRATVITIRTTAGERTIEHTLLIAGSRVRNTGEHDVWRLYDTKANTITFVDDVERTIRTEPLHAIAARRRTANAAAIPPQFPRARLVRTNQTKPLQGATARAAVIESGDYRRELWLAEHPSIPRGLFAMMHVSDTTVSPLAPMMGAVDQALAAERGFPLVDRSTLKDKVVVERAVTGIAQRDVPQALFALPKGYKDTSPVARNPQR
jgi:hypothetical protein